MNFLRSRWEKNWPELRAALRGGFPEFVASAEPSELDDRVPVFSYHTVSREELEADLRFLDANEYVTLTADALLDHLQGSVATPPRSVVLTFDDGPLNLYAEVFPLLQRYARAAVAFIAPGIHAGLAARAGEMERPCSWNELREMHESGLVDIQSHTYEHRFVPEWPRPIRLTGVAPRFHRYREPLMSLAEDLERSREVIESELGKSVLHLAFPRYEGTAQAVEIGRRCGYRGFWWGPSPDRPINRPGDDGEHIVRLSGEFLRRLPGVGRAPLRGIMWRRYAAAPRRWSATNVMSGTDGTGELRPD